MYCPNCGSEMQDNDRYCPICGMQNQSVANTSPIAPKKKKTKLLIVVCVVALVLIAGAVVLAIVLNQNGGNGSLSDEKTAVETAIREELGAVLGYGDYCSPFLKAIVENFGVHVKSVSNEAGQSYAVCTFSNYDVAAAFSKIQATKEMTYDEYMNTIVQLLNKQKRVEKEVKVLIVEENGVMRAQLTEEQLDIATGGLLTYYSNMDYKLND